MFDLSACDAELDDLGRAPADAASLARAFSAELLLEPLAVDPRDAARLEQQLAQLDSALAELAAETGVVLAEPAPRARALHSVADLPGAPRFSPLAREPAHFDEPAHETSSPALSQSQEIVLPDPIAREELSSESGELSLEGEDPTSGSFELPAAPTQPRVSMNDLSSSPLARGSARFDHTGIASDLRSRAEPPASTLRSREEPPASTPPPSEPELEAPLAPPAQDVSGGPAGDLIPFDDVQDALEGSQPISLSATRRTAAPPLAHERDPDAEFDALLSEATDPRGVPTGAGSGELSPDELLKGLEGADFSEDEVSFEELPDDEPHEADLLTRSLFEDSEDSTEMMDRASLGAIEQSAGDDDRTLQGGALLADELDSGELEILVDDDATLSEQQARHKPPGASKAPPPPPPPSGSPGPRPSGGLLDRLFNKRESD